MTEVKRLIKNIFIGLKSQDMGREIEPCVEGLVKYEKNSYVEKCAERNVT